MTLASLLSGVGPDTFPSGRGVGPCGPGINPSRIPHDYRQLLLKLERFRGTTITGDILDSKQEHLHAFAMVREATAWLDPPLPLAARFPRGSIQREDRLPVPADALRKVILSAPWRYGPRYQPRDRSLPRSRHRPPPEFTDEAGVMTVTFKVPVVPDSASRHPVGTQSALSRFQVQVIEIAVIPRTLPQLMAPSGRTDRTKFRAHVLGPLLEAGLLEMTIPDKPRSSKQQYRTTEAGREELRGSS